MTTIKFLNGLDTIGGNVMEIATTHSRVIMDMGITGDVPAGTVQEQINAGALPNLPDLFLDQENGFDSEAIFISHLHIDHMGALKYIKKEIPIYLSPEAFDLYQLLISLGMEAPLAHPDQLHVLAYETPLKIGDLTVTGYASDHDTIGAMALLIEDGKHSFAHSGDVRLNGPHRANVDHWAQIFKAKHLDLFMLEGTTFSFDSPVPVEDSTAVTPEILSEASLQEKFKTTIMAIALPFMPVINPYPRNVERLKGFYDTSRSIHRKLVLEPAYGQIMKHFYPELTIYVRSEESIHGYEIVTDAMMNDHKEDYILQNSFDHLNSLLSFPFISYYHSNGEPLGDYDPRFDQLKQFLDDHRFTLTFLSCSGHATKPDLLTLATTVSAQTTVPWHSFKPQVMANVLEQQGKLKTLLPNKDIIYEFN